MATWILRWFNENLFWVFVNRENQCQQIRGLLQTYHKIKIGGRRKTRLQTKEKCKNFLKEFPSAFKTIRWFKKKTGICRGGPKHTEKPRQNRKKNMKHICRLNQRNRWFRFTQYTFTNQGKIYKKKKLFPSVLKKIRWFSKIPNWWKHFQTNDKQSWASDWNRWFRLTTVSFLETDDIWKTNSGIYRTDFTYAVGCWKPAAKPKRGGGPPKIFP